MARSSLLFALTLLLGTAGVVGLLSRELSRSWFLPASQEEVRGALERSLADQRELAHLVPGTAGQRRRRFEETQALLGRMRILALSRESLSQRHAGLLLGGALAVAVAAGGLHVLRQSRRNQRLAELQQALRELADGHPVRVQDRRRDVIGRVARMVEEVSVVHTRDRRRLASLEDLSRWQEAARRHAHEMRTPLAAAELDLARLRETTEAIEDGALREGIGSRTSDLEGDLRRLREFASAFAAFGRLPRPRLVERDLAGLVREFAERFSHAWPELRIDVAGNPAACPAWVDADLIREVLANLCENSAAALRDSGRGGTVSFVVAQAGERKTIDVVDDGPGIPAEVRPRLFQPYATFRRGGMGLGLAIARKILLDHGGELELLPSEQGAAFRLCLPAEPPE